MAYISVPNSFINGQVADANKVNSNFNAILEGLSDGTKDINVSKLDLSTLNIPSYTTAPSSPTTGELYLNTTDGYLNYYDGTQWVAVSLSADNNVVNVIDTVDSLRTSSYTGIVYVRQYYTPYLYPTDIGSGGIFIWDAFSTATDDNGVIIKKTAVTTGRWIRVLPGYVTPRFFGAIGSGTNDDYTAIAAAVSYCTTNSVLLKFDAGTYLTGTNLSITCDFDILPGAFISHGTTTITITGKLYSDPLYKLFSGTGSVSFTIIDHVRPEWFGAIADGTTNCTTPLTKCINTGKVTKLSEGTYLTDTIVITPNLSKVRIEGVDKFKSILKSRTVANDAIITQTNSDTIQGVSIYKVGFDSDYKTDYAIYYNRGKNINISECWFIKQNQISLKLGDSYSYLVTFYEVFIKDNLFDSVDFANNSTSSKDWSEICHTAIYLGNVYDSEIIGNICIGYTMYGIQSEAATNLISLNHIWTAGSYLPNMQYCGISVSGNNIITNNEFDSCLYGLRINGANNVVNSNYFLNTVHTTDDLRSIWIKASQYNISIINNVFKTVTDSVLVDTIQYEGTYPGNYTLTGNVYEKWKNNNSTLRKPFDFLLDVSMVDLGVTGILTSTNRINIDNPGGGYYLLNGNKNRWFIGNDASVEGGANSGSNLSILSYDDDGDLIGRPVKIERSTKKVTLSGDLGVTGMIGTNNRVTIDNTGGGYYLLNDNKNRWFIGNDSSSESGANSGSNLSVLSYDDNGDLIGKPIAIERSTKNVTFTNRINIDNPGGGYYLLNGNKNRWFIGNDSSSESGANSGSNLSVLSYDDNGDLIGKPIAIERSTKNVTLSGYLQITNCPNYATNASAIAGSMTTGMVYQTTGTLKIVY